MRIEREDDMSATDPGVAPEMPAEPLEAAEEHVTRRVPVVDPAATAGDIRALLAAHPFDSVAAVAVVEGERLAGLVTIDVLVRARSDAPAATIMDRDPPRIAPGVNREAVAWAAVQRGEDTLAVVDAGGRFLGLVPPHELLRLLLAEHDEDMARLGGFLAGVSIARHASEEPVIRRFWHRLPWLVVGLAGAVAAAQIVGAFEQQLRETVAIAFFIPGIVYMADAVGTQTETIVVRGLSVGVPVGRVLRRELLTGLLVGATIAAIFLLVGALTWGGEIALAVSLALFASCSVATMVAMSLPSLIDRAGLDPAFGSGPLSTVVQDLLSIVIYFAIALALID
jgi:magnesium transporter